jgi:hypothetical protein
MENEKEKEEVTQEIKTPREAHGIMNKLYLCVKKFADDESVPEGERGTMDLGDIDSQTLMRTIEICGQESKYLHKRCASLEQDLEAMRSKVDELTKALAKAKRKKF